MRNACRTRARINSPLFRRFQRAAIINSRIIISRIGKHVRHITMARSWLGCLFGILVPSVIFYLYLLLNGNCERSLHIDFCTGAKGMISGIVVSSPLRGDREVEPRREVAIVIGGGGEIEFAGGRPFSRMVAVKKQYRGNRP